MSQIHIHRHRALYRIKWEVENIFGDVVGLGVILLMIGVFVLATEIMRRYNMEKPIEMNEEL